VVADFLNDFKKHKIAFLDAQRDKYFDLLDDLRDDDNVARYIQLVKEGYPLPGDLPLEQDVREEIAQVLAAIDVFRLSLQPYNEKYSESLVKCITQCQNELVDEEEPINFKRFQELIATLENADIAIKETHLKFVATEITNCLEQLEKYHVHDVTLKCTK
jgi:hypothetical protein